MLQYLWYTHRTNIVSYNIVKIIYMYYMYKQKVYLRDRVKEGESVPIGWFTHEMPATVKAGARG